MCIKLSPLSDVVLFCSLNKSVEWGTVWSPQFSLLTCSAFYYSVHIAAILYQTPPPFSSSNAHSSVKRGQLNSTFSSRLFLWKPDSAYTISSFWETKTCGQQKINDSCVEWSVGRQDTSSSSHLDHELLSEGQSTFENCFINGLHSTCNT